MAAYYNEFDPKTAAWLRELIKDGLIAPGDVDERSITDVRADELSGYTQCHFFAGIGGWSYALRLAGWSDDEPVWTGSCPCQPFSVAGRGAGTNDSRHLWPVFSKLIEQCRPPVVFGEQVASADGRVWLSGVFADLEAMAYRRAGADLCAAGVGAPHIRQRLFWVADASGPRRRALLRPSQANGWKKIESDGHRDAGRLGDAGCSGNESDGQRGDTPRSTGKAAREEREQRSGDAAGHASASSRRVGDTDNPRSKGHHERRHCADKWSPWAASVVIPCADGKARRIEPGSFPLAHGIPGRVGLLRGYGNAIVPQVAATFIQAFCESADVTP